MIILFYSNQSHGTRSFSNRREDILFKGDSLKNTFFWLLRLVLYDSLDHIHIKNAKSRKSNGNGCIETSKEVLL